MDIQLPVRSSLRDFLHVLFKRKVQILLFFFATVCTVTIGTFLMKPTYEATSQILVKIGRENLYVPTVPNSGNNPVINVNREEQLNSEIEILKSPSLATEVVKALGPGTLYRGIGRPESRLFGESEAIITHPDFAGGSSRVEASKKTSVLRQSKNRTSFRSITKTPTRASPPLWSMHW
jgi:uncharacterized protein involved in exopolysaccharide biosynthesis